MGNSKKELWTPAEDAWLRTYWGRVSRATVAEILGRSETAVHVRAKRLKLRALVRQLHLLTAYRLSAALGLGCSKSAERLLRERLPSHVIYAGNKAILVVDERRLLRWFANPLNWYGLDLDKIPDGRVRRVVNAAQRDWDDEWLNAGEAQRLLHYTQGGFYRLARAEGLHKYRYGNWWFLRSDVEKVRNLVRK